MVQCGETLGDPQAPRRHWRLQGALKRPQAGSACRAHRALGAANHMLLALVSDCRSAHLPRDREDGSPSSLTSPPASPGIRFELSLNLFPSKCGRIVITSSPLAGLGGRTGKQVAKSGDQLPGLPFLSFPVLQRLRGGSGFHQPRGHLSWAVTQPQAQAEGRLGKEAMSRAQLSGQWLCFKVTAFWKPFTLGECSLKSSS